MDKLLAAAKLTLIGYSVIVGSYWALAQLIFGHSVFDRFFN